MRWFAGRDFGFVRRDDGAGDIFLHARELRRSGIAVLQENDAIAFEIERDERNGKWRAIRLRLLAGDEADAVPELDRRSGRDRAFID